MSEEERSLEAIAMNIVHQIGDALYDALPKDIAHDHFVDARQKTNDIAIDFAKKLIKSRDQQIALAARIDEPKPNTKEYLKLHSVKQPYTVHDIGYMDQLIRYHESIIDQLRKEIMQLKEN